MLRFAILSGLFCTLISVGGLQAQAVDPGQELLDEQRRQQQEEALAREQAGQVINTPELKGPVEEAMCFPIDEIMLTGNTIYGPDVFNPVLEEFSGKCIGQISISNLLERITILYADAGYITTRAYVPAQDVASGKLTIEVLEGRLEAYDYQQVRNGTEPEEGRDAKLDTEPPRVYRRVKHSEGEPYDEETTYPRLSG